MEIAITKEWNGNQTIREGRNGRTYTGVVGWRWIVTKGGDVVTDFARRRDAVEFVRKNDECPQCSRIGIGPLCKAHRADDDTTPPQAFGPASYPVDARMIATKAAPSHPSRLALGRDDSVTVDLTMHGEFKTTVAAVARYEQWSKRDLAKYIADAYGGGCGPASTQAHWLLFPKSVLAIVYGGMTDPRN